MADEERAYPDMKFSYGDNVGYARFHTAAAYHMVMHDISMTRFPANEAKLWDNILLLLKKRRDNLHVLGHSEVNRAMRK